ncbi:A-agglutinin anchorage subunit-like isoform X2 [Hypomesus transpacificus]|nr:A-agglutinin anchorage subunit-like isoform X2 [Hypomesus transpacificus]
MCSVRKILHILIGVNVIRISDTFSAGNYPDFHVACGSLLPDHPPFGVSPGETPFSVSPLHINAKKGEEVPVMLKSETPAMFMGFMLEARKSSDVNEPSVGKFKANSFTTLLNCNGLDGSAVSQKNPSEKTKVNVTWIAPETGTFYFRAAFVQDYTTFWKPNDIVLATTPSPSTTSTAPSTTSTAPSTTSTAPSTTSTDTSTTSTAPSTTSTAPSTTSTAPSTTSTAPSMTSTDTSTTSTAPSTTSTDTSTTSTAPSTTSTAPSTTSTAPSTTSTAPSTTSTDTSTTSTDTSTKSGVAIPLSIFGLGCLGVSVVIVTAVRGN